MTMTISRRQAMAGALFAIPAVAAMTGSAQAAGVRLLARLGDEVARGQPLLELHAQTAAELAYALEYARDAGDIVQIVA